MEEGAIKRVTAPQRASDGTAAYMPRLEEWLGVYARATLTLDNGVLVEVLADKPHADFYQTRLDVDNEHAGSAVDDYRNRVLGFSGDQHLV